ncbi:hypothetical protein ACVV4J_14550 [Escherichia coli]
MTEQQISRTQAWLESLRPKTLPSPLLQLSSGRRWHGGKVTSIHWSPCWH